MSPAAHPIDRRAGDAGASQLDEMGRDGRPPPLRPGMGDDRPMTTPPAPLTKDVLGLAAAFLTSGTAHLLRPQLFDPLIPPELPGPRHIVHASGVAEIVCGAGLLHPRTRHAAGVASAALLVAVWPGNMQMSRTYAARARRDGVSSKIALAVTLARLPMQIPMIRTALRAAGR